MPGTDNGSSVPIFDNGQALGSQANAEARIDLIAQAWAVLSGAGRPGARAGHGRGRDTHLVDHDAGLIRCWTRRWRTRNRAQRRLHPGLPAGRARERQPVRPRRGLGADGAGPAAPSSRRPPTRDLPLPLLHLAEPGAPRAATRMQAPRPYGLEPYVMAGDIYTPPWGAAAGAGTPGPRPGCTAPPSNRSSACARARDLCFMPCLPSHWQQAELTLRRDGRTMRFILMRSSPADAA